MARFFIDRPVFAWVIAIVAMLLGVLAIRTLPVAQFPNIAPPSIAISMNYPGASAETVQNTVVQIIEQQMSGIDGLVYFDSESNRDGSASITLTFSQKTNPDTAQVQVQNKLSLAIPRLPQTVQDQGIRVSKAVRNFLMVIGFVSTDGSMQNFDIADFIASNVQDPLTRTAGVGDFQIFGSQYAMRIWIDPAKLNAFGLMPSDITAAIGNQNVQIASGELGARPSLPGQRLNATVIGPSYLQTPAEFGAILLKVKPDGSRVLLRDVATVERAAQNYSATARFNGNPAAGIGVKLAAGANAMDTSAAVRNTIESLRTSFPPGLDVIYPYDTTPFVKLSIEGVIHTLIEAIVLVFCVMYLFLQNFRATLIPTLAVPVVLLGTFAVLSAFGYSINTLTMFGLVLAIGLLVDDAIVVVENVERLMVEEDLTPLEATRKSMDQISGALVGIGLVLSAVFFPMFFFGGSAGVIYRQFSITIISAMTLSVLVALIFTPALCATILRKPKKGHDARKGFFGWFNRGFDKTNNGYQKGARFMASRGWRFMIIYALLAGGMAVLYLRLPSSFLPNEDQGVMYVQVTAPPGATVERTQRAIDEITDFLLKDEAARVESAFTIVGFSFGGRGQNSALGFVKLKDWDQRKGKDDAVGALAGRLMAKFSSFQDAKIYAFAPPAVSELGNATGFNFFLLNRGGLTTTQLAQARDQLVASAQGNQIVTSVRANDLPDEPQYRLKIDWERASALGLSIADVNSTMATAFGAAYAGDFLDRGRVKRVYVQGDAPSRMLPEDLGKWYIRNASGQMVSFSAIASADWEVGPPKLARYNGVSAVEIQGDAAPGHSTGAAMAEMERLVKQLPQQGLAIDWTGLSYEERASGSQAFALYGISMLVVFLCLAALYESWAIPISVMLVVPLGILGAVLATLMRGYANDVYFQVALLTTIGLSAKNAILIVEFAKEHFEAGENLLDSAMHAARERLRPIIMTSLAFILGVVPLAISNGAGAGGQNAIGTGIIGGVIAGTILALLFVPVFFVLVLKLFRTKPKAHREQPPPQPQIQHAPAAGGDD